MSRLKRPETLGQRVRMAREMAGISARHLDELAHITAGHTAMIERGSRPNIQTRIAAALAAALGLTLDWMVRGEGAPPTESEVLTAVQRAEASGRRRTGTDN